jgi:hypothetical protein
MKTPGRWSNRSSADGGGQGDYQGDDQHKEEKFRDDDPSTNCDNDQNE